MALNAYDYIYCSPFLPIESLDAVLADPKDKFWGYADPGPTPEESLSQKLDRDRLHLWLGDLSPPLAAIARLLMRGLNQAAIARELGLSEAMISKRMTQMRAVGARKLAPLRHSILLN